jgi:hypothetical protein
MARPISLKQAMPVPDVKIDSPGLEVAPKPFFVQPKGLDYLNPKQRVTPDHMIEGLNLYVDRGSIRSRYGTSTVGGTAADPVMAVLNFVTSGGVGFLLRFTTQNLQKLVGGVSWENVGLLGPTFTGTTENLFTYTAFNDTLVFSNGVDGMWEYAPLLGTLNQIEGAPSAEHLTTFNERVVASVADGIGGRMQWSASRNSHDWEGIGSGFEDLLSTPGGVVDGLMGVFPISDDIALMVRSTSVWQVSTTGDPDAPFRFGRLFANLGSRSRHSIDVLPGGIVLLGTDNVYVLSDTQISPIGELVKDRMFLTASDITKARGVYRAKPKEYYLTLGDSDTLYRYSFNDQAWSRHRYPWGIRWFDESVFHWEGVTWDDMIGEGTWDAQTESWNSMLGDSRNESFYFATTEDLGNTTEEDSAEFDDSFVATGFSAHGIEIQTPVLQAATYLDKTELIEMQLEYEQADVTQDITIEYSTDGGTIWNTYSTKTFTITSGTYPAIKRALRTLERHAFQFRLRSSTLGRLRLLGLYAFVVQGAKVHP